MLAVTDRSSRKIDLSSPLSEKYSHWLTSPCPCIHTINFKKSEVFFAPKSADVRFRRNHCPQYVRTERPTVCKSLLWTATNVNNNIFPKSNSCTMHKLLFFDTFPGLTCDPVGDAGINSSGISVGGGGKSSSAASAAAAAAAAAASCSAFCRA